MEFILKQIHGPLKKWLVWKLNEDPAATKKLSLQPLQVLIDVAHFLSSLMVSCAFLVEMSPTAH